MNIEHGVHTKSFIHTSFSFMDFVIGFKHFVYVWMKILTWNHTWNMLRIHLIGSKQCLVI